VNEVQPQQHEMVLEKTHESGAEEWYCPTCGRRFIMSWPPKYKKIVLDPGDEYALHSGGKGGVNMLAVQVGQEQDLTSIDEQALIPFQEWMEKVDFESLWRRGDQ
jgi:hypothetical protein